LLEIWEYRGKKGWHDPLTVEMSTPHRVDPYHEQLRHFAAVIDGSETPVCSGEDGTRTLAATFAVHRVVTSGAAVTLTNDVKKGGSEDASNTV